MSAGLAGLRAALDGLSERRAAAIAGLVTLAIGLLTMTSDLIGVFFDDAIYVLVAKAMAEGQGYVYPQLPGTPPAIHYPPLWPALIAVVWKLGPEFPANVPLLKLLNPVLLALAAVGGTIVTRRMLQLPAWVAMGIVLAATSSVPMHVLTNVLLSEPAFIALLFPALWLAERTRAEGGWRLALAAGLLGGALVLTRTIAGAYVVATGLALLWDRRWRETLVYGAVVALCIAPWQYFVWKYAAGFPDELRGSYGPYLEWLVEGYRGGGLPFLRGVVAKNAADTWRFVGAVVTPSLPGTVIRPAATVLALAATLGGGAVALWRGPTRILALGTAGYLAIVIVWPYQVERFLWAVWPLLLLLAFVGARALVHALRRDGRLRAAQAASALALLLAVGHSFYNIRGQARGWAGGAAHAMSERLEGIVRYVNGDPRVRGGVLATEADPVVALYTGVQTVPVEILAVTDHLRKKAPDERARILEAIDRRFAPSAYVVMPESPYLEGMFRARFDPSRNFTEITPPGVNVRSFILVRP